MPKLNEALTRLRATLAEAGNKSIYKYGANMSDGTLKKYGAKAIDASRKSPCACGKTVPKAGSMGATVHGPCEIEPGDRVVKWVNRDGKYWKLYCAQQQTAADEKSGKLTKGGGRCKNWPNDCTRGNILAPGEECEECGEVYEP